MHIEPEVVTGAKLFLSYATAAGAFGLTAKLALDSVRSNGGAAALALRSLLTTALVFCFFEVFPHHAVGVSEVHLILGSTLLLLFGAGATAVGLALGLLLQGLLFAQFDLPQYGMNVTTLLVPLWAISVLAKRIIAPGTAYVDLSYKQALALSTAYQGGGNVVIEFQAGADLEKDSRVHAGPPAYLPSARAASTTALQAPSRGLNPTFSRLGYPHCWPMPNLPSCPHTRKISASWHAAHRL